jgi:hypothetical protein
VRGNDPPVEDEDAAEEGRPVTERLPECDADWGDNEPIDTSLARLGRCWAGSLDLMASANARETKSTSSVGTTCWPAFEEALDREGVEKLPALPGVGIPECRGLVDIWGCLGPKGQLK